MCLSNCSLRHYDKGGGWEQEDEGQLEEGTVVNDDMADIIAAAATMTTMTPAHAGAKRAHEQQQQQQQQQAPQPGAAGVPTAQRQARLPPARCADTQPPPRKHVATQGARAAREGAPGGSGTARKRHVTTAPYKHASAVSRFFGGGCKRSIHVSYYSSKPPGFSHCTIK
jgi:hypothetical protein